MIRLLIRHGSKSEQAKFRDTLCESLVGWKPFKDSEVVVSDGVGGESSKFYLTELVIGPNPPNKNEKITTIEICEKDLDISHGVIKN